MKSSRQAVSFIEASPGPVFVHCQFGCDRTGTIVACYRIHHYNWSGESALREAESHGMSRLEFEMRRFVVEFARTVSREARTAPPAH